MSAVGWLLFADCCNGLSKRFSDYSLQVQHFAEDTPTRFVSFVKRAGNPIDINVTKFRTAAAKWHRDVRNLQDDIETKFSLEFERDWENDGFEPVCSNVALVYTTFLVADSLVLLVLLLVVLRILWKDFCTVYGSNRRSVQIQFHAALASVECLVILNWPLFQLSMSAVELAHQFKSAVDALKKIQVQLLVTDSFRLCLYRS